MSRADGTTTTGFRPAARRRNRIAAGVAIGAAAIAGNVLVYAGLDDDEPVLQATQDIPAGTRIEPGMVRSVDASVDETVAVVPADRLDLVVGAYAKVRIVAGSLVTDPALQDRPLVTPGRSIVAIEVPEGLVPAGLRERVPVDLVLPADRLDGTGSGPLVVRGRVIGLPTSPDSVVGSRSISVEVDAADAATVVAGEVVRVVLVEPVPDPAAADTVGDEGG